MVYICKICAYKYDESKEGIPFAELPQDWVCPICGAPKSLFEAESPSEKNAELLSGAAPGKSPDADGRKLGDAMAEALFECGVKWVFGMVGHSNLGIADGIRRNGKINFISIRHEGAAAFACSGYGKLTGKPAACLSIAGPGATNLMTGLYDAKLDGAPLLAITGQVPTSDLGSYIFQEIDFNALFKDVAVWQYTIMNQDRAALAVRLAYKHSIISSGVSQISVPDDVQTMAVPGEIQKSDISLKKACFGASLEESAKAAKFILQYKRPAVLIGAGCGGAMDEVLKFVETLKCPAFTTYRAKGFIPDSHPYSCGLVGRSGSNVSAKFLSEADCIIALGSGLSRHTAIPDDKPVLQLDCNIASIGRLRRADFPIVGDIASTLPHMRAVIAEERNFEDRSADIAAEWAAWRAEKKRRSGESRIGAISPAHIFSELSKYVSKDAVVSVDVGNVAYSFGRYFEAENQRFLLSFYLGSIGVGLPSAMGAWCASKEEGGAFCGRKVVAVVGDGGLGQYLAEWTSVVANSMDIKCVVINNGELAKISKEQKAANFPVWETKLNNPNFAEYSRSCGAAGIRISDPEKLPEQLAEAFSIDGPVMIEIMADPNLS